MHPALYMLQTSVSPDQMEQAQKILAVILPMLGLFIVICMVVVIVPFWFICKKAGFSPWLSLLNVIPVGNLILIYVLAFADWKVMPLVPAAYVPQPPFPPQPPYPPRA